MYNIFFVSTAYSACEGNHRKADHEYLRCVYTYIYVVEIRMFYGPDVNTFVCRLKGSSTDLMRLAYPAFGS